MKKIFAFAVSLVLIFSALFCMSVSYAVTSPSASKTDSGGTAEYPVVVTTKTAAKLLAIDDASLTEEQKNAVDEAREALEASAPEGYVAQYLNYVEAEKYPCEAKIQIDNATEFIVKLFVNGVWEEIPCKVVDGELVITIPAEGVLVIFTK